MKTSLLLKIAAEIIIISMLLPGCGPEKPVQINFIGSITGKMAELGMTGRNAAQMAVDQCNEQGGIHGRPVQLIIKNDRQNEAIAVTATQDLIHQGVDIIISPTASPIDSAMLCQQIRKSKTAVNITSSNWAASQRFLEIGGNAVEGVSLPVAFDWECPNPLYRSFVETNSNRYYRPPGFSGAYNYDILRVAIRALKACKSGRQDIKQALLSLGKIKGFQNKITFDPYGDIKPITPLIKVVKNRKFTATE